MKSNINKTTCKEHTNICAWVQFYDANGNYDEVFIEEVKLKDIPEAVIENFEANPDIVLYVASGDMVGVFAKNPWDIIEYVNGFYGTEGLKELLGEYTEDEKIKCTVTRLFKVLKKR